MLRNFTKVRFASSLRKLSQAPDKSCTEKETPCKPKCPTEPKKDCKPVECPENICCPPKPKVKKPRNFLEDDCHTGYLVYKVITLLLAVPLLAIATWVIVRTPNHEEVERPPFVKYSYLRIRTKKFPWGDGNHTLFHNPRVNPLPDGYEDGNNEEEE